MIDPFFSSSWFIVIAGLLALYLLATPLITKFTFRLEAQTTLHLIDMDSRLGDESDDYMDRASIQLAELGFDPVCLASVPQSMSNVKVWIKLFRHPQNTDDAAIELFYLEQAGVWKPHSQCVEFGSDYADGTLITTGNQEIFSVWPIAEHKTLSMFPDATDLRWLYEAHGAICKLKAAGKRKIDSLNVKFNGDAGTYLAESMNQEHVPAVEKGYLYYRHGVQDTASLDASDPRTVNPYAPPTQPTIAAQYGATLKGAYLMTWQLLWSFNKLVKRTRVRQSHARLREVGFLK